MTSVGLLPNFTPLRVIGISSGRLASSYIDRDPFGTKCIHHRNDIPVFFVQDAMQFPDFVHAVKPEPHNEVPTGQSAHNNFWDFFSLQSQTAHTVFWAMSDRGIPRSLRMMQGFGVNTFTLINAKRERHFVKFHWTPELGVHSLMWDEALKIAGQDPDFHRKDLEEAIVTGAYPKWKFGVQVGRDSILSHL